MKFRHRSLMVRVRMNPKVMREGQVRLNVAPRRVAKQGSPNVPKALQSWLQLGATAQTRASSSQRLRVWQPRLPRCEAETMRNNVPLSAADLDRFLHMDE